MDSGSIAKRIPRVNTIDVARTVALIAMAIYHFSWDLAIFGYAEADLPQQPGMIIFARCIAGSFIFLAGVSLILAHDGDIRWPAFWKRLLQIALAALAVTIATFFAFPETYIFFGILHLIAAASLLGLLFLRFQWLTMIAIGALIVALPQMFRSEAFNAGPLLWLGLADAPPRSNDYVPLFPWFGIFLFGMAFARIGRERHWFERLAATRFDTALPGWLAFPGRHSLIVYLVHQPILLGLVWLAATIAPPAITLDDVRAPCERSCLAQAGDATFCTKYCGCILGAMQREGLLYRGAGQGSLTDQQLQFVDEQRTRCVSEVDSERMEPPNRSERPIDKESAR
ncbi:heparan-alpha-glucosaminide N-acetyltransferase [Notoacmeibacter marinus]|uniref:heparan-alpha-glucosaminide N-acetyltransferase n=1 Tax=Notoacmeibacter marinus TaxID=1876515 RepID=UPI000DF31740|nr:heparan-alpha-glucosaminide N-acetyltransferase [Notoacmeibacter marinus]